MADQAMPDTKSLTIMGVLLILFGIVAITTPAVAGKAVVIVIGVALLCVGVAQVVAGFKAEGWSQKLPPLLLGGFAVLCGACLLIEPIHGMLSIALLMAIFFVVEGAWKIFASFSYRPASGWLMMLASGFIALLLGLMIWKQWPLSGLWAVGIFVGVDMITSGVSMIAVASTAKRIAKAVSSTGSGPAVPSPS